MNELDLATLVRAQLEILGLLDADVEIIALGKAAGEMAEAVCIALGDQVRQGFVVVDDDVDVTTLAIPRCEVMVGQHPLPGNKSLATGRRLIDFLEQSDGRAVTVFLISGGASSLCAVPQTPVGLDDLASIWRGALANAVDITRLNQLRALTSGIAGGRVLRHVRSTRSVSLIMVDNVVSGPSWVASGLTYEYQPPPDEVLGLLEDVGLSNSDVGQRVMQAYEERSRTMTALSSAHRNVVVAEPSMMYGLAAHEAVTRGYRVIDMGQDVQGDVTDVVDRWASVIEREVSGGDPFCLLGVGEVTVKVVGEGLGGRCQDFAWRMALVLERVGRSGVFVARSSDGRDHLAGVSGAWSDASTRERCSQEGLSFEELVETNSSFVGHHALGQLLVGGHSGWNLCDVYVATFDAP